MSTTVKPLYRALRLEVEGDPLPGSLTNLVPNTDGELGGWGWITPVAGSIMEGYPNSSGIRSLRYNPYATATAVQPQWFTTEPMLVPAGHYVAASWHVPQPGYWWRARFEFLRADGSLISSSPQTNYIGGGAYAGTTSHGPFLTPALTVFVRLRFDVYDNNAGANPAPGLYVYLDDVTVAQATTAGALGSNVTNLVGNPSYEADLAGWSPTGSVAIVRDTAEHQHGVASLRIENTNTLTRTNWLGNPSAEVGMSNVSAEFNAVITREAGGTSGGACWRVQGPQNTGNRQRRAGLLNRGVACSYYTDIVHARASIRFDAGWNAGSKAELILRWYTNLGLTEVGSTTIAGIAMPAAGVWYTLDGNAFVPPNAQYVAVSVESYQGGTGGVVTPSDNMWVDAMLLELGGSGKYTGDGSYFDGSTPDSALVANEFVGTPHVDGFSTQTTRVAPAGDPGTVSAAMSGYGAQYHTVSAYVKRGASSEAGWVGLTLNWYAGGALVRSDRVTNLVQLTDTAWHRVVRTVAAPADADAVTVGVFVPFSDPLSVYYVDAVMVELGEVAHDFIVGSISDSDLSYIEPIPYVNVLGTTHDITVTREGLNVGTLTAHIVDTALDPTQASIVRPGRAVRLTARDSLDDAWRPVFTGMATHAVVEYELARADDRKRADIELTATDNIGRLANQARTEGVGTVAELPYVLEGCGVPWNVNGSGAGVPGATIAATSEGSSALDQVTVTRDSQLGYAWVNRMGVLYAVDSAHAPTTPRGELDEDTYSDIAVVFDSQTLINEVNLRVLTYDPDGELTTEEAFGPYRDEDSITEWGVWQAEFTVQGLGNDPTVLANYAGKILTANATPVPHISTMQLHVDLAEDWHAVDSWYAWLDLYDVVAVTCARANMDSMPAQVVGITHNISGPDSKWQTELAFHAPTALALRGEPRAGENDWPVELPSAASGSVGSGPVQAPPPSGGGGGTTFDAGAGLSLTGTDLHVNVDNVGLEIPVDTLQLKAGGVTNAKLAPNAVTSDKIADGTIQAADIAPGVIPTPPTTLPPSGPAGGDLAGTYPNPTIKAGAVDLTTDVTGILPPGQGGTGYDTNTLAGQAGAREQLGAVGWYTQNTPALTANTWATVTHGLDTIAPQVQFIEAGGGNEGVDLDWRPTGLNTIDIRAGVAIAAGALLVTVQG